ncbi:MAG: SH3 domain-containing protein [Candidatus Omnitrophica bacterium]|nr:SH3 domain-containing protein [Candidatus Omnitrophota bacterium]
MRIFPLFLAVLLLSSPRARAEEPPFRGLVTGDRVHVRAGPGLSYEILFSLDKRARVEVVAREGDWYGVRLPEGTRLYVHRSLVEFTGEQGRVLKDRVQVRAGPGVTYSRLAVLSKGEVLRVASAEGDWVGIHPPESCRGWIHQGYVTYLEPTGSTAGETS